MEDPYQPYVAGYDDETDDADVSDDVARPGDLLDAPAESIYARHEAFLGLPLRTARVARSGPGIPPRADRVAEAPTLTLAAPVVVGGAESPTPTAFADPIGHVGSIVDPGHAPRADRHIVTAYAGSVAPLITAHPATSDRFAVTELVAGGSRLADERFAPRPTTGLHALRQMATVEPLQSTRSAGALAMSVAAKHGSTTAGSPAQGVRKYSVAPVALAMSRRLTMARAAAILRAAGGLGQPTVGQPVWPAAASVGVAMPAGLRVAPTTVITDSRDVAGHDSPVVISDHAAGGALGESPKITWSSGIAVLPEYEQPDQGAGSWRGFLPADEQAGSGVPYRRWRTGASIGPLVQTFSHAADRMLATGGSVIGGEPEPSIVGAHGRWAIRPRSGRRIESLSFPSSIRRMQTTAADLILRRAPGVAARSFLGAEANRLLNWPATPTGVDAPLSPVASPGSTIAGHPEALGPPEVGGPLPAAAGRGRRAMRIESITATLSPQYPANALMAPSPGGAWHAVTTPMPGAQSTSAQEHREAMVGGIDAGSAPVPPELVPAFAARRAQHATWGESLAVGSPPSFLAVERSGASAVEVGRPIAGVLRRLAFADAWHRPVGGGPHVSWERAATAAAGRLPLGRTRVDASARSRSGDRQPAPGWPPSGSWPSVFASPHPAGSTGLVGGWSTSELPLSTFHRGVQDEFARGGLPGGLAVAPGLAGVPSSRVSTHRAVMRAVGIDPIAGVSPVYAGGWPTAASEQMVLQRRSRVHTLASSVPAPGGGVSPFAGIMGSGPMGGPDGGASMMEGPAASMMEGPAASPWTATASLPVVRAWRRLMPATPAAPAQVPSFARWPVFRSALPDVAEPGAVQRSTAAEAMTASEGQALPPLVRRSMEHLFRMDLASVRVHSGPRAARATGAVAARAMAHGTDIYLPGGVGESPRGGEMPLLAHELTHVAQHLGHRPPSAMPSLTLARRSAPEEHDADQIERMVADAVQDRPAAQREPATELTLARRPASMTIMRVEGDAAPPVTTASAGPGSSPGTAETGTDEKDKTEQIKKTDKMAEELFRRLERRLIVARERGGHRW
ncbi:MAG: eCIS core domain-containing protein [Thermomicrobiales bacterium]